MLEHVPDIQQALKRHIRILRAGLLLIIPFNHFTYHARHGTIIENGQITHPLPEQYHGNPLSHKGSLVFYDYGWDFLTYSKVTGFKDVYVYDMLLKFLFWLHQRWITKYVCLSKVV